MVEAVAFGVCFEPFSLDRFGDVGGGGEDDDVDNFRELDSGELTWIGDICAAFRTIGGGGADTGDGDFN